MVNILGSPLMGDIQISLFDRRGILEVEIIRAKGLIVKPGSKTLPGKGMVTIATMFSMNSKKTFYHLRK